MENLIKYCKDLLKFCNLVNHCGIIDIRGNFNSYYTAECAIRTRVDNYNYVVRTKVYDALMDGIDKVAVLTIEHKDNVYFLCEKEITVIDFIKVCDYNKLYLEQEYQ